MTAYRNLCLLFVVGLLLIAGRAQAQTWQQGTPQTMPMPMPQSPMDPGTNNDDPERARMLHDMQKRANEDRQAALRKDTDQLFKLAAELKTYVDKTNENILSMDVLKKAEAIEKLAHSVKDKMKGPN